MTVNYAEWFKFADDAVTAVVDLMSCELISIDRIEPLSSAYRIGFLAQPGQDVNSEHVVVLIECFELYSLIINDEFRFTNVEYGEEWPDHESEIRTLTDLGCRFLRKELIWNERMSGLFRGRRRLDLFLDGERWSFDSIRRFGG